MEWLKQIRDRWLERDDLPDPLRLMQNQVEFEKIGDSIVVAGDAPDETILGVAVFFTNFSTFTGKRGLYLEDIHDVEQTRGQGIGTSLLQRLASLASEQGCGRLKWVVLDWNERAIEFYRGLGAGLLPDWRIVRAEDEQIRRIAVSPEQDQR